MKSLKNGFIKRFDARNQSGKYVCIQKAKNRSEGFKSQNLAKFFWGAV